jgi:hypothetical protein
MCVYTQTFDLCLTQIQQAAHFSTFPPLTAFVAATAPKIKRARLLCIMNRREESVARARVIFSLVSVAANDANNSTPVAAWFAKKKRAHLLN